MADRPILFSGPMVRALIEGRKTQTRRVLRGVPDWCSNDRHPGYSCFTPPGHISFRGYHPEDGYGEKFVRLPFINGDRLWVRETWAVTTIYDGFRAAQINPEGVPLYCGIRYAATDARLGIKDRPSIHMPRWASRLTLIVTNVQVHRLQEISEAEARSEGLRKGISGWFPVPGADGSGTTARAAFALLWNNLNASRGFGWDANPWVVALTFTVHQQNIDQMGAK